MASESQVELIPLPDNVGILQPRPYQREAVEAVFREWQTQSATLVVLPTGMGKTFVAAHVGCRWPGEGRILFLAHLREILFQTQDLFEKHLGERPGLEMGIHSEGIEGHGIFDRPKVLCASVQTVRSRKKRLNPRDYDVVVIDEAHHAACESYRGIWRWLLDNNPGIKALLITATPNRADNLSLACIAPTCAYQMSLEDGINQGYLVAPRQRVVRIKGLNFKKLRTKTNSEGENDFTDRDIARLMGGAEVNDTMDEAQKRLLLKQAEQMCHKIAQPAIIEAAGRQAIIFCASVSQSVRMAQILRRWSDEGVTAAAITGATEPDERNQIVNDFRAKKIQFLCLCQIGTEGFDVPSVELIVMARPTKSIGFYLQCLGRGTRVLPGVIDGIETEEGRKAAIAASAKPFMTVMDFVGTSRFKLVNTKDVLAGDMPPDLVDEVIDEIAKSGQSVDVREAVRKRKERKDKEEREREEEACRLRKLMQEKDEAGRSAIRADVEYEIENVDLFDPSAVRATITQQQFRGGCSDAQIDMLVRLGMPRDKAMRLNSKQASGAIGERKKRTGKDYIVRMHGRCMGKSLSQIARENVAELKRLASTCRDPELLRNIDQYREQWKAGDR